MLFLITKANDSYWYEFKIITTLNELLEIYDSIIIEKNDYQTWSKEELLDFWDDFKEEDIPLMKKAENHIIIYNDYVE